MTNQLTDKVKLLQKAVLIHRGEALILKRSADSKSRAEKWDLAGGNSEWPVTAESGFGGHRLDIVREIEEEAAITTTPEQFSLSELVFFDTFFDATAQIYSIICGWKCILPDDFSRKQVIISPEHTAVAWTSLENLDTFDFGGDHGEFIKQMIKKALTN